MKYSLLILLFFLCAPFIVTSHAQSAKSLQVTQTKASVLGTSTLHDWECVSEKFDIKATGSMESGQVKTVESLTATIPVKSLKSGKSGMDDNTYKALKESKNPNIIFELTSPVEVSNGQAEISGNLTIAGKTQPVKISSKVNGNTFAGSFVTKMTEFGVDPPKAMMGTIKTGDDITLQFEVTFK
ncbi:YceI family protein [Limibacter armeniacum]|uniref:YceI family protein n=1 Tax=Limibacter armeniacum TaxID=466084 RepID=UPI002FE61DC6